MHPFENTLKILALIGVFLSLVLFAPPSEALVPICASNRPSSQDARRLLAAVRLLIPHASIDRDRLMYCANPGNAWAIVATTRKSVGDGVESWTVVKCNRKPVRWTCRDPVKRSWLRMNLNADSVSVPHEVAFDAALTAMQVRAIVKEAADAVRDRLESLPLCIDVLDLKLAREDVHRDFANRQAYFLVEQRESSIRVSASSTSFVEFPLQEGIADGTNACWGAEFFN